MFTWTIITLLTVIRPIMLLAQSIDRSKAKDTEDSAIPTQACHSQTSHQPQHSTHSTTASMGKIDDRLTELNLVLPAATEPTGPFVNVVRAGNLLFTGTCDWCVRVLCVMNSPVLFLAWHSRSHILLFLDYMIAGHVSQSATGEFITGKMGKDLTPKEGYAAAQRVVLSLLTTLKSAFCFVLSLAVQCPDKYPFYDANVVLMLAHAYNRGVGQSGPHQAHRQAHGLCELR